VEKKLKHLVEIKYYHWELLVYWVFIIPARFIAKTCCKKTVFRRQEYRHKVYDKAMEKLRVELDISELLRVSRISKFLFRFMFDRNHREFVKYFNRYCIKERLLGIDGPLTDNDLFPRKFVGLGTSRQELTYFPTIHRKTPEEVLRNFRPTDDKLDKLITEEILESENSDVEVINPMDKNAARAYLRLGTIDRRANPEGLSNNSSTHGTPKVKVDDMFESEKEVTGEEGSSSSSNAADKV